MTDLNKKIKELVNDNDVCLFMKGTPDMPQCGFSLTVSNILKYLKVNFKAINVLEDENLDRELKISVIGQLYLNYM